LKLDQHLASECLCFPGESTAFGIGETKAPPTQALLQHAVLLLEILDRIQLVTVDPTCEHQKEHLNRSAESSYMMASMYCRSVSVCSPPRSAHSGLVARAPLPPQVNRSERIGFGNPTDRAEGISTCEIIVRDVGVARSNPVTPTTSPGVLTGQIVPILFRRHGQIEGSRFSRSRPSGSERIRFRRFTADTPVQAGARRRGCSAYAASDAGCAVPALHNASRLASIGAR
jgi:hypothetical protein